MASARDLGFYGALHYVGVPGLRFGGGVWSGNSGQGNAPHLADAGTPDLAGISGRITSLAMDRSGGVILCDRRNDVLFRLN